MVSIIDSTLREGSQALCERLTIAQSVVIASLLRELRVDMIECGHPSIDAAELERVRSVAEAAGNVPVLSHARAATKDVDAVADSGASWIGVFLGCNGVTQRARVPGRSLRDLRRMTEKTVAHAGRKGLRIRFTVEDGSRTDTKILLDQFRVALDAGADRLCLADTVGCLEPQGVAELVVRVMGCFSGAQLEVHLHDDRGLALANALAAVDAGASWVSTSANGLGERAGITDLAVLLFNLHLRRERPITRPDLLQELSQCVGRFANSMPDDRRPVVGRHAFRHMSRLHQKAVMREPSSYELADPGIVGRCREIGASL